MKIHTRKKFKKQITAATLLCSLLATIICVNMKLIDVAGSGDVLEAEGLLKSKENINEQDNFGNTPLYEAVIKNKEAMVKFLLEHHAKPDIGNKQGYLPLYIAALQGNNVIIKILLANGARATINRKNGYKDGGIFTPLHAAIMRGHIETVQILLENGADPKIETADGEDSYQLAEKLKNKAVIDILNRYK